MVEDHIPNLKSTKISIFGFAASVNCWKTKTNAVDMYNMVIHLVMFSVEQVVQLLGGGI